jgi:hypothetical protein
VHHKDGRNVHNPSPNNSMSNLQLLCKLCHTRLHSALRKGKPRKKVAA